MGSDTAWMPCQQLGDGRRKPARPKGSGINAGDVDAALAQQGVAAPGLLGQGHAGAAHLGGLNGDGQRVVQPRRGQIAQHGAADHEDGASFFAQRLLADAGGAQPLGAGALEELQVVGIEHHAAGIGVLPVHTHRVAKAAGFGQGHLGQVCRVSRPARAAAGAAPLPTGVGRWQSSGRSQCCGSWRPKSRPGVSATWARSISSKAKSQLSAWWARQSAQA